MNASNRMIQSLHDGKLEQGLKEFSEVKKTGTDDEKFELAEELFQLGFLEQAKELFELLIESYPDEAELKILLAETLVEMDQAEEALLQLDNINSNDEFYPRSLLLAADLYQMQGLFEVSERKLKQAVQKLPDEPVIQFALAELYNEQGRFLEAIRHYKEVLNHDIKEIAGVHIQQRLGECYSAGGAFEEALPYYEKALEDSREINTLFGYGFTAFQASHHRTSIEILSEVIEIDPEYHSAYLLLAKAYEHEEQLEEALESAENGLKADPFNKELYLYTGKLYLKEGNERNAESNLRQAIALDPNFLEAALLLNRLLIKQEKAEDILEVINVVESAGESDPQFHWDAAKAFEWLEEFEKASDEYTQAYVVYNDHIDFLEDYGLFLLEESRLSEAREIFLKLAKKDPTNEDWQQTLERLEQM
ncbi:tetratricopeptide repeat protein [Jeotgalibacillus sp. ET6]|uniref:tetratricopeptide repeat protein n=1 Tax=Jeotgalibacillus sp. ET6 TaxID=3037260 RepID=UPI002418A448|nr:tetratricopeptide repeat protein [Jeotgalibacillus sp. ET6]MDG5470639.1 tetratricopeptide repeat protein [Jeotgalibacillus sp. ET6]